MGSGQGAPGWGEGDQGAAQAAAWLRGAVTLAALRGYGEDELGALADLGYACFQRGRFDLATTLFEGLASLTGREYPLRALAAIAVATGRPADALPLLDAAIAQAPHAMAARLLRAEVQLGLGRYAAAAADLDLVAQTSPRDAEEEVLRRRAVAHRRRLARPAG